MGQIITQENGNVLVVDGMTAREYCARGKYVYLIRDYDRQLIPIMPEGEPLVRRNGEPLADTIRRALDLAAADDAARLRKALVDVRHALQFANDSPNGGITGTLWMMHSPETVFDFIDATLERDGDKVEDSPGWRLWASAWALAAGLVLAAGAAVLVLK